jgi:ketosteroid isomerase-like protein
MSEENVKVVRAVYEAFAQGGIDRWIAHWSDDVEYWGIDLDDGPVHGKDAVRANIQDWIDTFDEFTFYPLELTAAGSNDVVTVERFSGRAKFSGVETNQTLGVVFTIRDGKIARCREYATPREAREVAGLRE